MKRETLSEAIGGIDGRYLAEALAPAPVGASGPSERIRPMKKKRFITLALAAALLLSLGVAAYAVGSIHARRQQELHDSLQADNTASYVEYEVPGENDSGAVLLSSINDGDFHKVYVDLSPVSEEELAMIPQDRQLMWTMDGVQGRAMCLPQLPDGLSLHTQEEIRQAEYEYCYDPETETFTVYCAVANSYHLQGAEEEAEIHIGLWHGDELLRDFGTVRFRLTDTEMRNLYLDHARTETEDGRELRIIGLELTPVSAVWKFDFDNAETVYADREPEAMRQWVTAMEYVSIHAQIEFSDGTSFSTGGTMTSEYRDGAVCNSVGWGTAVDIHAVQRITLDGTVLWEAR